MKLLRTVALVALLAMALPQPLRAQVPVARELIEEATEQIFKSAARQSAQELGEMGGKATVREILEQSSREGGEQLVRRVTQYGIEDGPMALRAIRPAPAKMVQSLDGLSPELRTAALRAVDRDPQLMTNLVKEYGSGALEAAARHPGVGDRLVGTLGEDGVALGRNLSTDQSIITARHADDIASLPATQRSAVVKKILSSPNVVLDYLESHPRVLRTAAGVAIVLAIKNDIIGDKGRSIIGRDGKIVTTPPHPGLIERLFPQAVHAASFPLTIVFAIIAAGVAGWLGIHLWGKWRIERIRARHQL